MEIIHIVLGKANPERMNGVNKVVFNLVTQQINSGRNASVWGITKTLDTNFAPRNFETRLFQAHRNPFHLNKSLKQALLSIKGKAILHLHGGWIPVFSSLSRFLAKHKIPYVVTPHGCYSKVARQRNGYLKSLYFKMYELNFLKRAYKIHCLGNSEVTGLAGIFPNDKTTLLPYGFEPKLRAESIPKLDNRFVLGFVGRLDIRHKGLDILLDAYSNFLPHNPASKLWIVGDGPDRSRLEKMVTQKRLQKDVILWGSKFGLEKESLINQMDVFVHSSRNEGLPVAVLEACAAGIPCVVTEATNVAQYVTQYQCGVAVSDENREQLTQAFITLSSLNQKGELATQGQNGKRLVSETFTWTRILKEFDKLYS